MRSITITWQASKYTCNFHQVHNLKMFQTAKKFATECTFSAANADLQMQRHSLATFLHLQRQEQGAALRQQNHLCGDKPSSNLGSAVMDVCSLKRGNFKLLKLSECIILQLHIYLQLQLSISGSDRQCPTTTKDRRPPIGTICAKLKLACR